LLKMTRHHHINTIDSTETRAVLLAPHDEASCGFVVSYISGLKAIQQ